MFEKIINNVIQKTPLVHNITNYVTVNDCANIILACGGSPIMSDDSNEVEEITAICNSLVLNIGTLNQRTIFSMRKAGKKANELGHPVVLDPVGVGASKLRDDTVFQLLQEMKFSVIRGNISEIKAIGQGSGTTKGVDADVADAVREENLEEAIVFAKALSKKTGAVIVITGAIDIVADQEKAFVIRNGHPFMSKVTGTGCMLTAILGCYIGANPDNMLEAAATAVCLMGVCGEQAYHIIKEQNAGIGTFKTMMMDKVSQMTPESLKGEAKIESK